MILQMQICSSRILATAAANGRARTMPMEVMVTEEETLRRLNHMYPSAHSTAAESQYRHVCVTTFLFFIIGGTLVSAGEYIKSKVAQGDSDFHDNNGYKLFLVSILIISVGVVIMMLCVFRVLYYFVIKEAGSGGGIDLGYGFYPKPSSSSPGVEFKCQIESETNSVVALEDFDYEISNSQPPKYEEAAICSETNLLTNNCSNDDTQIVENDELVGSNDDPPCYDELSSLS